MNRHRIISEHRGADADAWLREFDRKGGDPAAFIRHVVIDNGRHYQPAPQARGPITIPRAAVTHEVEIEGRRYALTVCREPRFLLLEELRE